jgi:protoporphyrinogen oxidase
MNDPGGGAIIRTDAAALHCDAVVLGAGITGLVSASILSDQGCRRVLVVDEYEHIGGNHIDRSCGAYTFDVGSFIFQDDSPLLRHFPELLDRYTPIFPTWGRLNPQRMVTTYPISITDDILSAGIKDILHILASAAYARVFHRNIQNARDFARYWIGDRLLYRSGLETYMKRFYGVPPEQIDVQLAEKRMLWISEHASLGNIVRRLLRPPQKGPPNQQLARPREGFAHLYKAAREKLEAKGVTFLMGADYRALEKCGEMFSLRLNGETITSPRVISTIPLDRATSLCGIASDDELKTITLLSLFFSFSGNRGFEQSVLYNFSHEGSWKRITMYSDFYGAANGREYFTAEVILDQTDGAAGSAEDEFRKHVHANSLFNGDLTLEGSFVLKNAYPIYSKGSGGQAAAAIRALKALGIESFGRQGGFDYQPTARVSTIEAETALRRDPP